MDKNKKSLRLKLFELQQMDIKIEKNKEAHHYSYAPLDTIIEVLKPKLKELRIGYYHIAGYDNQANQNTLTTVIFNVDNEDDCINSITNINENTKLGSMNTFMVLGSAMTYFRRYHLVAMLGLLADEDSDAGGAKSTNSKKGGKSVMTAVEEGPNFIAIFDNLIKKGKTEIIIRKSLKNYEKQMPNEQHEAVTKLIDDHFKTQ